MLCITLIDISNKIILGTSFISRTPNIIDWKFIPLKSKYFLIFIVKQTLKIRQFLRNKRAVKNLG